MIETHAQQHEHDDRDRLLPVDEVARRLGVSTQTVVVHVRENGLRSLDGGELLAHGDRHTPLIRERELTRFIQEHIDTLRSASKSVVTDDLVQNTPVLVAYAFVMALADEDADTVWQASSCASREAFNTQKDLVKWWSQYLDIDTAPDPGVSSAMYPIGDAAIAVNYIADTPPSGGVIQRPTLIEANPLALVEDPDGWRVDQPLQARCADWKHLVAAAQPASSDPDDANGPT